MLASPGGSITTVKPFIKETQLTARRFLAGTQKMNRNSMSHLAGFWKISRNPEFQTEQTLFILYIPFIKQLNLKRKTKEL